MPKKMKTTITLKVLTDAELPTSVVDDLILSTSAQLESIRDDHGIDYEPSVSFSRDVEPETVAIEFARIVRRDLADHLSTIIERNRTIAHHACATHDFCDANELMAEAMEAATGRSQIGITDSTEDCRLWSAAWGIAKRHEFDVARIRGSRIRLVDNLLEGYRPDTTKRRKVTQLSMGNRVRLVDDQERYPHFIVPAGAYGTVVDTTDGVVSVRMDDRIEGAESWENELYFDEDHAHCEVDVIDG
jgi:hypothetical protein